MLRFKKLIVNMDGAIKTFNGYYLRGNVENARIFWKDNHGDLVSRINEDCGSVYNAGSFDNTIKHFKDTIFNIAKTPNESSYGDVATIRASQIVDYEFY